MRRNSSSSTSRTRCDGGECVPDAGLDDRSGGRSVPVMRPLPRLRGAIAPMRRLWPRRSRRTGTSSSISRFASTPRHREGLNTGATETRQAPGGSD
jgi:hypothetical protein